MASRTVAGAGIKKRLFLKKVSQKLQLFGIEYPLCRLLGRRWSEMSQQEQLPSDGHKDSEGTRERIKTLELRTFEGTSRLECLEVLLNHPACSIVVHHGRRFGQAVHRLRSGKHPLDGLFPGRRLRLEDMHYGEGQFGDFRFRVLTCTDCDSSPPRPSPFRSPGKWNVVVSWATRTTA
jgi:hypothetical protein